MILVVFNKSLAKPANLWAKRPRMASPTQRRSVGLAIQLGFYARMADAVFVLLGAYVASGIRYHAAMSWSDPIAILVSFNCVLTALIFPIVGIYQSWRGRSLWELLMRLVGGWTIVCFMGATFLFAIHQSTDLSRLWFIVWFTATLGLMMAAKVAGHLLLKSVRQRGYNLKSVAIVGLNNYSRHLIDRLREAPQSGFRPACLLDEGASPGAFINGLPVLTAFDDLVQAVRQRKIHEIWLVLSLKEEERIHHILTEFRHDFVNIRFIPNVQNIALFNHSVSDILGVPAFNLLASPVADMRFVPKEAFDRIFACLVLLCIAPMMLTIAIIIKSTTPGPIFFKQLRKGIDGFEFKIYKFRTMVVHNEEPGQLKQASKNDARITSFGAFLRRTSLDELPQFINVLRGEMSVVGPRPHAVQHDEQYKDLVHGYMFRYRIKPGITGWAQINGFRGETDKIEKMEGRVQLDLYYIENWSFSLDLKIVLMTFAKGFFGKNAY
jgi:putative colanic acid biosynthesis UDP-glucose lipid carrier transferase